MGLTKFSFLSPSDKRPWGLGWRSSNWLICLVVAVGVGTDLAIYTLIVPIVPFRLMQLGYTDVSSITGWLLFAYSIGLVLSTPPIAYLGERYSNRRDPLLLALIFLAASLLLFMFSPNLAGMIIARIGQGIAGTAIWIGGMALICDSVSEEEVGKYLGIVMSAFSVGPLIGPPISGALYRAAAHSSASNAWHYPFVFALCLVAVDLIGRLILIEKHIARKWNSDVVGGKAHAGPALAKDAAQLQEHEHEHILNPHGLKVLLSLLRSPVAWVCAGITAAYGIIIASQDTALTLRLNALYGYSALQVGLVYIAPVVASVFMSPIAGWLTDRIGAKWIASILLTGAVPFAILLRIRTSAAVFIVFFALLGTFLAGSLAPVMAELARMTRGLPGVGYAHSYSFFNISYAAASCVGPIIGGQIYDHVSNGWLVLCILWGALILVCVPPSLALMEDKTGLSSWFARRIGVRRSGQDLEEVNPVEQKEVDGDRTDAV